MLAFGLQPAEAVSQRNRDRKLGDDQQAETAEQQRQEAASLIRGARVDQRRRVVSLDDHWSVTRGLPTEVDLQQAGFACLDLELVLLVVERAEVGKHIFSAEELLLFVFESEGLSDQRLLVGPQHLAVSRPHL